MRVPPLNPSPPGPGWPWITYPPTPTKSPASQTLTTHGFNACLGAVEDAFGADVDYAMLVKT